MLRYDYVPACVRDVYISTSGSLGRLTGQAFQSEAFRESQKSPADLHAEGRECSAAPLVYSPFL